MKRYIFLFVFLCCVYPLWSQQLYHFNQYLFNDLILNPAVAGTNPCKTMGLDLRKQWVGFDGSPATQTVFFHGKFLKKVGLGSILYNDKAGAVSTLGTELDYAYQPVRNRDHLLSFGLGASVLQYSMNQSDFQPETANDPSLTGASPSKVTFDMSTGVYYKNNYFLISFGAKHLLQTKLNISNTNNNKLIRHYYFSASYNVLINNKVHFEPSVFIRSIGRPLPQTDFSAKFIFNDLYWLGLSYRFRDAAIVFAGIDLGQFTIGYGFEYSLSLLNPYTNGSHEVFLKYRFCKDNNENLFTSEIEGVKKRRRGYRSVDCPVW